MSWEDLNSNEQRYVKALEPHFPLIIAELNKALPNSNVAITGKEFCTSVAPKIGIDVGFVIAGFGAAVRAGIIVGLIGKRKVGYKRLPDVNRISIDTKVVIGDAPAAKRRGRPGHNSEPPESSETPVVANPDGLIVLKKNKTPFERAQANPKSLRLAINAKCYDCSGGDSPGTKRSIRECSVLKCSLHPVRPYQVKEDDEEDDEIVSNENDASDVEEEDATPIAS